jgi:hypothetical protein
VRLWGDGHPSIALAHSDVLDGIGATATALDSRLRRVHRSDTGLLDELPGYAYQKTYRRRTTQARRPLMRRAALRHRLNRA